MERSKKITDIVFIDYSKTHRGHARKTAPRRQLSGKFVQIRHDATEYLVFSSKEFAPYHADLVEWFCSEKKIKGRYSSEGKRFNILDPAWRVVGGGRYEIDETKRCIRLYDNSMAYGRFDSRGLKEKILSTDRMSDYEVRIE